MFITVKMHDTGPRENKKKKPNTHKKNNKKKNPTPNKTKQKSSGTEMSLTC